VIDDSIWGVESKVCSLKTGGGEYGVLVEWYGRRGMEIVIMG